MSKLLGMVNTLKIEDTLDYLDGYIFGFRGFAINCLCSFSLEELIEPIQKLKKQKKEIYLLMNKNMHKKDIKNLKSILKEIDKLKINGIFYADNAFLTLKDELNLQTKLVWYQEHLGTSYTSINTYYEYGIKSSVISNDITIHEVKEIMEQTNSELYYMIFGYLPMFVSERHQIQNYEKHFKLNGETNYNYFINENVKYPIIDNELGTFAFSSLPVFAYQEYLEIKDKMPYVILSDLLIEKEKFLQILKKIKNETDEEIDMKTSPNFLYQDTIYKIK